VEPVGDGVTVLQVATKFAVQRRFGKIGYVGGHAGDRQPSDRVSSEAQITPPTPIRVRYDRLATDFVKRNVLRRMTRGSGERNRRKHAIGVACPPLRSEE